MSRISVLSLSTILQSHLRYRAIAVATTIPNAIEVVLILLLGWFFGINGMIFAVAIFGYVSFTFFYLATVKREPFKKWLEHSKLLRTLMNIY